MQQHARTVIIGAGIAGCSVAYHLVKLGRRDVVVVDQGPLFHTGGSSSHAPGGLSQTYASPMMSAFGSYSIELYAGLRTDEGPAAVQVGGVETAQTEARWQELKRRAGWNLSFGIETRLLTPAECVALHPLLNPDLLQGGVYTPDDGVGWPVRAVQAMAAGVGDAAAFHGETHVTGIETKNGAVCAVVTDKGRIETEEVVCCAGIWGPRIGRLVGVTIPLQAMQHQYVKFEPLVELSDATDEVTLPILRARDQDFYIRQHFDCLGLGNYKHEPLAVDTNALADFAPGNPEPSRLPFTPADFTETRAAVDELIPALGGKGLTDTFNGMFSFTPDGMPLIGEASSVRGFWVAEAVWISHGGGVGKALAEIMVGGEAEIDLREADLNRFGSHVYNRAFIRARGEEAYRNVHAIIHPSEPSRRPRNIRLSPLHERLVAQGAQFFDAGGWERPQWCEANRDLLKGANFPGRDGWGSMFWSPIQAAEHRHTRQAVAMYDLSAFSIFEISGPGAAAFLEQVCANRINMVTGRVVYTPVCNIKGGVVCDATVVRLDTQQYWFVTGAVGGPYHLDWLRRLANSNDYVRIEDVSSSWCVIGLCGPKARDVLSAVSDADLSNAAFPYFSSRIIELGYALARANRVSYTGELGWELYVPVELGVTVWDALWQAGQANDVIAAGAGAMDSLRIEKGYRRWGADLHRDRNALEAGLDAFVKLDKDDFIGAAALRGVRADGVAHKLACIALDDPEMVVFGKEPILLGDRVLGYVTSGNFGYTVDRSIAYGYVPSEFARKGQAVEIEYFGARLAATISAEPLYDPKGLRLRA